MKINLLNVQKDPSPIEGIEVHVERVDKTIAMIIDNYCNASSSTCLPSAVRLNAIQPCRTRGNVIDRREINVLSICAVGIQGVEIVERQWVLIAFDDSEINFWSCVDQLSSNVGWEVFLARIEPYDRCYED